MLVLGRISNLPTVWSNCLAAWLLTGGGSWSHFALVCLGATFLYTGGMFLNDAVDQSFDCQYRPERPIPRGRITPGTVWALSALWLLAGWVMFLPLGGSAVLCSSALLAAIIGYDLVHKHTVFAPVLMASCRFLLYLAAASPGGAAGHRFLLWRAAVLAAYIVGLSYLARGESKPTSSVWWTLLLLFAPVVLALLQSDSMTATVLALAGVQVLWTVWCLLRRKSLIPSGVSGLLAGIVLVDALAASGHGLTAVFTILFVSALSLQRLAPAS